MSTVYWLKSPLRVPMTCNKDFILNMNHYRNTHYQSLNKAKKNYKDLVSNQILKLPELHFVEVWLVLHPETAQIMDTSNVCSVHEKFLMDAIVENNRLEDDNYKFTHWSHYGYGTPCREDPRVDVYIKDHSDGSKIRTYPNFIKG